MKPLSIDKVLWIEPAKGIAAMGFIPKESEFFQDHFPGFPVLPGVLALEMMRQTAEHFLRLVRQAPKLKTSVRRIRNVKFTHYLKPGDEWETQLQLIKEEARLSIWQGRLMHEGRVAVTATLELELIAVPAVMATT